MRAALSFRFTDFEIDTARQELRRAGTIVHIEPQVFDLLVHLIRNRDRIVSKDELIDSIWQGRIVSDATLSSRISSARRALGDSGNDQSLIRTLHKRGFRFVGEVDETSVPAAVAIEQAPSAQRAPHDAAKLVPNGEGCSCSTSLRLRSHRFTTLAAIRIRSALRRAALLSRFRRSHFPTARRLRPPMVQYCPMTSGLTPDPWRRRPRRLGGGLHETCCSPPP
jgi:DNA-binding winged helix-turn-helix (wHTH) protein